MKKTNLVLGFMLLMFFVSCLNLMAAGTQPNGVGTEASPYIVGLPAHLLWISTNSGSWSKYFEQNTSLDASSLTWTPIGDWGTNFTGTYDGGGYTIDGLTYSSGASGKGVFGAAVGAVIKNLGITNVDMTGYNQVGGLAGYADGSEITNCYVTGSVLATNQIGGGLVGENKNSTITNCYSTANMSGGNFRSRIGGLVGSNDNSTITNCYGSGTVSGGNWLGGLVGEHKAGADINNCYATGNVAMSNNTAGGLVGYTENSSISNSYSIGSVNDDGLIGIKNNTTVSNCFWDTQTSGQSSSDGGTGKTTVEMKTQSTFTDAGWDFYGESVNGSDEFWNIGNGRNDGYPYLKWEYPSDPPLPVTLSSFTAIFEDCSPQLMWTTQSETDNLGFNIYRSLVDNGFETGNTIQINTNLIDGMGNTTEPTDYSFIDEYPVVEGTTYYYWLQSVSTTNELEVFGPIELEVPIQGEIPTAILETVLNPNYPNPFNPQTTIYFSIEEGETGIFTIFNIRGQEILKDQYETGEHIIEWNAEGLSSGIYFYRLISPSTDVTKKMILMK